MLWDPLVLFRMLRRVWLAMVHKAKDLQTTGAEPMAPSIALKALDCKLPTWPVPVLTWRGSIAVQCLGHIYYIWWAVGYRVRAGLYHAFMAVSCSVALIVFSAHDIPFRAVLIAQWPKQIGSTKVNRGIMTCRVRAKVVGFMHCAYITDDMWWQVLPQPLYQYLSCG